MKKAAITLCTIILLSAGLQACGKKEQPATQEEANILQLMELGSVNSADWGKPVSGDSQ